MRAQISPMMTMMMGTLLLAGCASGPRRDAPAQAGLDAAGAGGARRAAIKRQIAAACPSPLTAPELERAAALIARYRDDREIVRMVGRQDRMDRETRLCRD